MNDPGHRRPCDQLYAFELGLLEGEQLEEFERHLLDCADCRREAESFLPAAHLLKHDPEIRGLVEGLQAPELPREKRSYTHWPAILAIAAAVILLVLRPWNLEFHPTQEVTASENRLAVLYVASPNDSDDDMAFGRTIANLLSTDLSESRHLRVVSSQRMYDVARQLDLPDPLRIDQANAGALARQVGAKWMLTAGLVTDGRERRLVTQLYDVASGEIEATQSVRVDTATSVFALVDDLSVQLKNDLGLPVSAQDEPDPKVADVTTHSVEAYQCFLKGIELRQRMYSSNAMDMFFKAIKLDSTFAMAYYYLALDGGADYIKKAVQYAAHTTRKEQMFIKALEADLKWDTTAALTQLKEIVDEYPDEKLAVFQLGQYYHNRGDDGPAIYYLEQTLALDPAYRPALNLLAYAYGVSGRFDEALQSLDEYAAIAPDEPNPLDSRGDMLALRGRLDEAIAAYEKALQIAPDFSPSRLKLYYAYLADGRYDKAEEICQYWEAKAKPSELPSVYGARANSHIQRGQYRRGLEWLDRAIGTGSRSGSDEFKSVAAELSSMRAQLLLALDSSAVDAAHQTIAYRLEKHPEDKISYRITLARAYEQAGLHDSADQTVGKLRSDCDAAKQSLFSYWMAAGYLALARGSYSQAAELFDSAAGRRLSITEYLMRYLQGQALVLDGQAEKAVETLGKLENFYGEARTLDCITSPKLYYYLGLAYEESGRIDSATTRYEKFLNTWSEADPDLPELIDARQRLARLRTNP